MAQGQGAGVLANIAIAKARVEKSKQLLGLSGQGVPKAQAGPPPKAPADTRPAQSVAPQTPGPEPQLATAGAATVDEAHGHLRNQVAQFLQGMQGQPGAQNTPAPATGAPPTEPAAPAPAPQTMTQQVAATGAQNLSLQEQFYRLAGRAPSPRELSIFSSRMLLEQQLGRPPTQIELRNYITRPAMVSPSAPVAFPSR